MPPDPDKLANVARADRDLRDHDRRRRHVWNRRANAIAEARAERFTYREIAAVIGVTEARCRQMAVPADD